ncbi:MAG: AraC family transcriptional regulator [Oscillospiraceae bacterium]|nr:AraC family transcriptional regulator [Lentisphaeria bacterium]MBP3305878.1 AraC family transcriptional regulator [Oscillospiraceae bacterium]
MRELLLSFNFDPRHYPCNLYMCGVTYDEPNHVVMRQNFEMYLIEYILEGAGTLFYNGSSYSVGAGDAYILHKNSTHRYFPDPKQPWKKIWFMVDGPLVPSLITGFDLQNEFLFPGFNQDRPFKELITIAQKNLPLEELNRMIGLQLHILLSMMSKHRTISKHQDVALQVREMLDNKLYEKLNLDAVAEELFLSKAHIINVFKLKYGITPYQYYIQQKIKIAAALLSHSILPINKIADMLHFSDSRYFSYAFKKIVGVSPNHYRKLKLTYFDSLAQERLVNSGLKVNFNTEPLVPCHEFGPQQEEKNNTPSDTPPEARE